MTESIMNDFQSDFFDSIASNPVLSTENSATLPPLDFSFVHEQRLGRKAIVVHDLLSQRECDEMVAFIDSHEGAPTSPHSAHTMMTAASSSPTHRNNQRLCISSQALSSTLIDRLRPLMTSLDQHKITCSTDNAHTFLNKGFGMDGEWRIDHLNPRFRLCKYHPGGHFGPHYDSDFVVDAMKKRSLKTFMIYLNDNYDGGETNFVENHELNFDKDRQIYCAPTDCIFAALKARRGDCLVFDHLLLHEGQQVTRGQKYIIRTDLMYEKNEDPGDDVDEALASKREKQRQALDLFLAGSKLEEGGDTDAAIKNYRRAFKICPEIEDAYA